MDNWLEILVPLIFAGIYFFGNMMSGKEGEDESGSPPARRSREKSTDPEVEQRQRQVQEEIRRKIMERKRAASAENTGGAQGSAERQRSATGQRQVSQETVRKETVAPQQPPTLPTVPETSAEKPTGVFSWEESDNAYDREMEAQLARIEETKRRAAALKAQTQHAEGKVATSTSKTSRRRRYFSGSVRSSLRDPAAARAAIIYSEVLNAPISLRKGEA